MDRVMRIKIDGLTMAYNVSGVGAPLTLIHGFPLNKIMWRPQVSSLSRRFRVVALDLPGFGESEAPPGPCSMDRFADYVGALLRQLRIHSSVVVGHSMGGYVTFRLYARHRSLVGGMVLANTRAEADSPEGKQGRLATIERIKREGLTSYISESAEKLVSPATMARRPEILRTLRDIMKAASEHSIVSTLHALAERPDSTPLLSEITVPTLVITGAQDQIIPFDSAGRMHSSIRGSQLVTIQSTGHMSNLEDPEAFNRAVLQSFRRPSSASGISDR